MFASMVYLLINVEKKIPQDVTSYFRRKSKWVIKRFSKIKNSYMKFDLINQYFFTKISCISLFMYFNKNKTNTHNCVKGFRFLV